MVNHSKGVDQVVRLHGNKGAELLGVPGGKADVVFEAKNGSTLACQLHGLLGEVDCGDVRASAGEVDGVCADAAADFQDFFAAPTLEFGESGNVVFDEVFAGFYLVEIFLGADCGGRMANVAGTGVPIVADARDFDIGEGHGKSIAKRNTLRHAADGTQNHWGAKGTAWEVLEERKRK